MTRCGIPAATSYLKQQELSFRSKIELIQGNSPSHNVTQNTTDSLASIEN